MNKSEETCVCVRCDNPACRCQSDARKAGEGGCCCGPACRCADACKCAPRCGCAG